MDSSGIDTPGGESTLPRVFRDLRDALDGRRRRELQRPGEAAVLVPVVDDGGPVRLVLTRRTAHLKTHAGQVAFPGGGYHDEDTGPVSAALREAQEEIALPPGRVDVMGLLDDFPTVTDQVVVTPVVGRVSDLPELRADPGEVARIFTIPIEALLERPRWRTTEYEKLGNRWKVFFFDWDDETLWGLSAYIVLHLLELFPDVDAPFELPKVPLR